MAEKITEKWWLVDARGRILGRLATQVATILRGKDKPGFAPHLDAGDFVVVVNASQVRLTGQKLKDKIYYRHSGYPGGLKSITARDLLAKHPDRLVRNAVQGMLPKNKLSAKIIKKLKIYPGSEHPHQAQKPQALPG